MPEPAVRLCLYSIPAEAGFVDALAAGLIERFGRDPLHLARGRVLLPSNRAVRSLTEAFVRLSGGGLVLPRLIAIGDLEIGDRVGGALDPLDLGEPVPPAVAPFDRQVRLATILQNARLAEGAEALRLAADLGRTLDALTIERQSPADLLALGDAIELPDHWRRATGLLAALADQWPAMLRDSGQIDLADRRNRLLDALAERWGRRPPEGFTVAAGVTTAAPAIAGLLARIARMDGGMVVLPGLAPVSVMNDAEWEALAPRDASGPPQETHPQFAMKRLLDRMGARRDDVIDWTPVEATPDQQARARAVAQALAVADFTDKWRRLPAADRALPGVRCALFDEPASEAQAIALALRGALETPGKRAALVTPDRALADRVVAHLRRWGIEADDSAGQPLSQTPAGLLLLNLAQLVDSRVGPVAAVALLKHPRVGGEEGARLAWLEQVRLLDLALRGPRPKEGLAGLDQRVAEADARVRGAQGAWDALRGPLDAVVAAMGQPRTLGQMASALREAATLLAGEAAFGGADGRATGAWLEEVEASAAAQALAIDGDELEPLLRRLLGEVAVRRPYGGHPRIAIWGLLEARLQQADLMILAGLNEGSWPGQPSPDPWLAPALRRRLGHVSLDQRIGLAAHDFASAMAGGEVLLTRAKREGRSPTVASRFWLRLQALSGGIVRDTALEEWTRRIDQGPAATPMPMPRPAPPADRRPRKIAVTNLDRLAADPFAYYARSMLKLYALDPLEARTEASRKGTMVHDILEKWQVEDQCAPGMLQPRLDAFMQREDIHPLLRSLWKPRVAAALAQFEAFVEEDRATGRDPRFAELKGETTLGGVTVEGRLDRLDRLADGTLAIVDYKTGNPPSARQVAAGFALQLGLLSAIVERGGLGTLRGKVSAAEYWSASKNGDRFGKRRRANSDKTLADVDFTAWSIAKFEELAARYLTGNEPFLPKRQPAFARDDYDHYARFEEWHARPA